jgi:hypothetical protein
MFSSSSGEKFLILKIHIPCFGSLTMSSDGSSSSEHIGIGMYDLIFSLNCLFLYSTDRAVSIYRMVLAMLFWCVHLCYFDSNHFP